MKIKIVTLGTVTAFALVAQAAQAVVADKFQCTTTITDTQAHSSIQTHDEFYIARLPLSASPAPDVRITNGSKGESHELRTGDRLITTNLNFYYEHAVKLGPDSSVVDARQASCLAFSADFCDTKASEGPIQSCSASIMACAIISDPFDAVHGWAKVGVTPSGMPLFDERSLVSQTFPVKDDRGTEQGTVKIDCGYQGSFE